METKNIINIPEGYEIDREKSTERQIVLKKIKSKKIVLKKIERPRTWEEYCDKMKGKTSYYVSSYDYEVKSSLFGDTPLVEEFDNKEDAVAFDAFCKLRKMRKDWVKEWKPDWTNIYQPKYAIANSSNKLVDCTCREISHPLSFPTEEMRDEFFNCFKDLLEQAKSLL